MKEQKGITKKTSSWLLFLSFFILFMMSPSFGWIDEREEDEKSGRGVKNQLLVLPIVYYTPLTKIAGGVGGIYYLRSLKDQLKGHPSTFFMDIIYSQEKQFILEITPDLYLGKGKFHLVGYMGFKKYAEQFYGIGPKTTKDMEENYRYRSIKLKFSLHKRISPSFYVGLQYDLEDSKITEVEPGGILDSGDIVGNEGGTISGLGILLVLDNRDNIFFSKKGTLLQANVSLFSHAFGSDYNLLFKQW